MATLYATSSKDSHPLGTIGGSIASVVLSVIVAVAVALCTVPAGAQLIIPEDVEAVSPKPPQLPPSVSTNQSMQNVPTSQTPPNTSQTLTNSAERSVAGLKVRFPKEVRVRVPVRIEIEAENPDVVQRIGTLALSIQGGNPSVTTQKDTYDVFLPGGNAKISRFSQDGSVWRLQPGSKSIFPSMTHVEVYDENWPQKGKKILSVPVVFFESGPVTLLIRASFSKRTKDGVVVDRNIPDNEDDLDEQGLPCYRLNINVVE